MRHYLNEHLITNYRILLEYNPDLNDALGRTKKFDKWLEKAAPIYFKWTQHNIPAAVIARRTGYQAELFNIFREALKLSKESRKNIRHIAKSTLHSSLVINRYTMSFLQKQKEEHGIIYQLYNKMKNNNAK